MTTVNPDTGQKHKDGLPYKELTKWAYHFKIKFMIYIYYFSQADYTMPYVSTADMTGTTFLQI